MLIKPIQRNIFISTCFFGFRWGMSFDSGLISNETQYLLYIRWTHIHAVGCHHLPIGLQTPFLTWTTLESASLFSRVCSALSSSLVFLVFFFPFSLSSSLSSLFIFILASSLSTFCQYNFYKWMLDDECSYSPNLTNVIISFFVQSSPWHCNFIYFLSLDEPLHFSYINQPLRLTNVQVKTSATSETEQRRREQRPRLWPIRRLQTLHQHQTRSLH